VSVLGFAHDTNDEAVAPPKPPSASGRTSGGARPEPSAGLASCAAWAAKRSFSIITSAKATSFTRGNRIAAPQAGLESGQVLLPRFLTAIVTYLAPKT